MRARIPADDFVAATIDEVCREYANDYWKETKPKDRTFNIFNPPIVDPTETHAMVDYFIRYAAWGYEDRLILVKKQGKWRLMMTYEHTRFRFR